MKKKVIFLLSVIMMFSVLAGCAGQEEVTENLDIIATEEQTAPTLADKNSNATAAENKTAAAAEGSTKNNENSSPKADSDEQNAQQNGEEEVITDIITEEGGAEEPGISVSNNESKSNSGVKNNSSSKSNGGNTGGNTLQNSSKAETPKPESRVPQKDPNTITVYLSVDCITAYNSGNDIAKAVSQDGTIIAKTAYTVDKNTNVFELLKSTNLVVGSSSSSMGEYVYSIQSLSEKDCGSKSGWMYSVNGSYPGKSCDKYELSDGDTVCWRYTCNLGKDL